MFPLHKLALQNYPQIFLFKELDMSLGYIHLTYIKEIFKIISRNHNALINSVLYWQPIIFFKII